MAKIMLTSDWHIGAGEERAERIGIIADALRSSFSRPNIPDHILVTGDLTESGKVEEIAEAERLIDALRSCGAEVHPVPGNHDYRVRGVAMSESSVERFEGMMARVRSGRVEYPYEVDLGDGWGLYCSNSMEGQKEIEDIDDLATGDHGPDQRARLDRMLGDSTFEHKIMAFHHHPFDVANRLTGKWYERALGRNFCEMEDAKEILDIARKHGVKIIIFGHKHVEGIWKDFVGVEAMIALGRTTDPEDGWLKWHTLDLHDDGTYDVGVSQMRL